MLSAGVLSGLLGIGSGALKVLAMDSAMKVPFKVSTTTSNFMIGVTAVASSLIYFQRGEIIPVIVAPVLIGVVLGSFIGSKTLIVSQTKKLKLVFAVVVSILSIYMMQDGFIAPTLNLEEVDERCAMLRHVQEIIRHPVKIAAVQNFAFGGVNTILLFKKLS